MQLRVPVGGVFFILTGLAFLAGGFYPSPDISGGEAMLNQVAADPAGTARAAQLTLVYAICVVPALLAATHLVPGGRGATLTYLGAGLALYGNLFHGIVGILEFLTVGMAQAPSWEPILALLTWLDNQATVFLIIFPMAILYAVGLLLMVIGLYRSGVVPVWMVALVSIAVVLDMGPGNLLGGWIKTIVATALFVSLGIVLLRAAARNRAAQVEA